MEEIKTPTLEKIKAIQRESELFGKFFRLAASKIYCL